MIRFTSVCLLALLSLTCANPPEDGKAGLTLRMTVQGRVVPGVVRISSEAGSPVVPPELLPRGLGLEAALPIARWFVIPGTVTLRLPPGKYVIEGFHGLETEIGRAEIYLTAGVTIDFPLALHRFYDAGAKGLRGANTHLHLQKIDREAADRYLREVPRADGLDVVFLSYLERAEADREYVSNRHTLDDLRELSKSGVLFGNGEEHRHNFTGFGEGYGHVMLLDIRKLVQPVSIGPGIMLKGTDGLPLQRGIDEAKRDGATILWCHNTFGLEDIPNWVTGRPHAQNIFDGGPDQHGTYQHTFYRYLNAGLRVPFSTGTDWFIYDFSRAYVPVADLKSPADWLKGLRDGKSTITNGPFLEFDVAGRPVGETIRLAGPEKVRVRGRAIGRVDFRRIEVVRNGEVAGAAASRAEGNHFVAGLDLEVDMREPGWLALRIPPAPVKGDPPPASPVPMSEFGLPLFAHTSPVYVEVAGKAVFQRAVVQGLLDEVIKSRETIEKVAVFADDHERGHVVAVYAQAKAALEKLLK